MNDTLDRLVEGFLDARARGESPDAERLISENPKHAAGLRRRLAAIAQADEGLRKLRQASAPSKPELPGFELLETLGRGGMSSVFLARKDGKLLALKVMAPGWSADRFQREARTLSRLSHPGIVPVQSFAQAGGFWYLALDLIPGADLSALVGAEDLGAVVARRAAALGAPGPARDEAFWSRPRAEVCAAIARDVALALEHAHGHGVIHRDVKPSNVIVTLDGKAKLIDFGLTLAAGSHSITRSTDFLGTVLYASPEQAAGNAHAVGPESDVFSLGAVLYELLTGRRPFEGETVAQVLERLLRHEPAPMPEVPAPLAAVCLKALAKDRAARYRTAAAFAEDLQRFLDGKPVLARRPVSKKWAAAAAGLLAVGAVAFWPRAPKPAPEIVISVLDPLPPKPAAPPAKPLPRTTKEFSEALEKEPGNFRLRLLYGESLAKDGRLDEADRQFQACLALRPKDPTAQQSLAGNLARQGKIPEALAAYKTSLDYGAADGKTHMIIGELAESLGRFDEAIYFYSRAEKRGEKGARERIEKLSEKL